MLVTGFGMRNWDSLQRALLDDEQRRQMLLAKHDTTDEAFEYESVYTSLSSTSSLKTKSKISIFTPELDITSGKSPSLEYLMGLVTLDEEEEGISKKV